MGFHAPKLEKSPKAWQAEVTFLLRAGEKVAALRLTSSPSTEEKAMQMAEQVRFDLITLDVDLPGGNGFILCSRLKERPRFWDTPVVFVSGSCCLEDQRHGLEVGAVDFIEKPFGVEFAPRLLSQVRQAEEFSR